MCGDRGTWEISVPQFFYEHKTAQKKNEVLKIKANSDH